MVSESGTSRSSGPRHVPPPGRPPGCPRTRGRSRLGARSPDLPFTDAEHDRQDRFRELDEHMEEIAEAVTQAEKRREGIFHEMRMHESGSLMRQN